MFWCKKKPQKSRVESEESILKEMQDRINERLDELERHSKVWIFGERTIGRTRRVEVFRVDSIIEALLLYLNLAPEKEIIHHSEKIIFKEKEKEKKDE